MTKDFEKKGESPMAGQGFNRRAALKYMATAAAVSQMGQFDKWVFAGTPPTSGRAPTDHGHHQLTTEKKTSEPYKPRFFNPNEYLTMVLLTDLLIPTDDTPGAREAGVSEFIDFIIAHDPVNQPKFRQGLDWLDQESNKRFKNPFRLLKPEQQTSILEALSYKKKFKRGQEAGREFFKLARGYTVMGYYSSKPGMESLGVPTLRVHGHSPECPHHDDPEHKKLLKQA